ncbi:hypothetical protein L1987_05802 [Smallanthus sonchifolius]|uniref:Uncharacterized protein n=1 Tax=Smallanthus sonchifolius TaxID=185202 RepID=A0ACB9JWR4_9ASTR|nr:hypothetical protein L1987_05802 [Smallanthus sonchifolius]
MYGSAGYDPSIRGLWRRRSQEVVFKERERKKAAAESLLAAVERQGNSSRASHCPSFEYFVYQRHLCIAFEQLDANLSPEGVLGYQLLSIPLLPGNLLLALICLLLRRIVCSAANSVNPSDPGFQVMQQGQQLPISVPYNNIQSGQQMMFQSMHIALLNKPAANQKQLT